MTAATDPLRTELARFARMPVVLVATDYDGTLAPIVDRPDEARPIREAIVALRELAALPDTHVAVISGRALADLATLSRLPDEVHLVGSHGSEFDVGFAASLPDDARALRATLVDELCAVAAGRSGVLVEEKPSGAAIHVRMATASDRDAVLAAATAVAERHPGVHLRGGKLVLELSVVPTSKRSALDRVRHQTGASGAIFIGDDLTDEDAFAGLAGPDIGIKVGPGDTLARHRLADPASVASTLAFLAEARRAWLSGGSAVPIERHSLLSDHDTVALVTPNATVTWLSTPLAGTSALFADLLGGQSAGYLSVAPVSGGLPLGQRYLDDTLILETRWSGLRVVDYLDATGNGSRLVRAIEGDGDVEVVFAPRPDYGRAPARLALSGDALVLGGAEPALLHASGADWAIESDGLHDTARARLRAPAVLELDLGRTGRDDGEPAAREATSAHWREWLSALRLPERQRALVARSALTLRALTNPTGASMAAATTSLPEAIGGIRNWDYRYCWIRDGAVTAQALLSLGAVAEARAFVDWVHAVVVREGATELRPVYALDGSKLGPEAVIETLAGYAGSRPVRVGNAAEHQVQLDVFGPLSSLITDLARATGAASAADRALAAQVVDAVAARWHEPDHGIWEIRKAPRHHVHSKAMCYTAVACAIELERLCGSEPPSTWRDLADEIRDDLATRGFKPEIGAFTAAYDGHDLDAAVLLLAAPGGPLAADDPRYVSTVHAIEQHLRAGPVVYRYHADDGLPGREGAFLLCTGWLIEAYARAGRIDDAEQLLERMAGLAGPTGLFSEEYDPTAEQALGNHPQAYSHAALISAVMTLDRVRAGLR